MERKNALGKLHQLSAGKENGMEKDLVLTFKPAVEEA